MVKLLILVVITIAWQFLSYWLDDNKIINATFSIVLAFLLTFIAIRILYLVSVNIPNILNGIKWFHDWLFS